MVVLVFVLTFVFLFLGGSNADDKTSGSNDEDSITLASLLPVITLKGDAEITLVQGNPYVEPGYDINDIDLLDKVIIEGHVDITRAGIYEIRYHVANTNGDAASAVRTVTVAARSPDAQVPIFMYHEVADTTWGIENLFVKVNEFEAQMKYLSDHGYQTLFVNEIRCQTGFHKKVVLTFDDAYIGFYTHIFPILKKYTIKATLYVITSCMDGTPYVSTEQLREIHDSGLVQIGSHSITHPELPNLNQTDMEAEIKGSQEALEAVLGTPVTSFAYPIGAYSSQVIDITKLYYDDALITGGTIAGINSETNYYTLPRYGVYRSTTLQAFMDMCSHGR
ncbi:MAG: polysaccharide deacetylase family protein [Peptococcaceae bacterium]|nr:polysaccharide deacetylase family protein [Peptococcaceae bacterium]